MDVGDRIAVETMIACHHCGPCLGGSYHLCDTRRIYSYIPLSEEPGLWGSYAQFMFLDPNAVVHRVDASLAPEIAVMFNPLGAGFRWAVEIPKTGPGDTVLILGPGQRGLASVLACREAGAEKVIVTGLAADAAKLAAIFEHAQPKSVTIVIMEVPCCLGLVQVAKHAMELSEKEIPMSVVQISLKGDILEEAKA